MSKKIKGKKPIYPEELIPFKNKDKTFTESWYEGRDLLNFPAPYRVLCFGPPHSGKSTNVMNIIIRAHPKFEKIYLWHCDGHGTREYDDIEFELIEEVPEPYDDMWDPSLKKLLIIDDIEWRHLNKNQLRKLDRIFGYTSTHKNLSIIVCVQDLFNLPPFLRRMANIYILYRVRDLDLFNIISRRCGFKKEYFETLFDEYIGDDKHSALWIDCTHGSPAVTRINGYNVI